MAATPDGGGYWLVAADGGIFSFGDATFHGSAGGLHLDRPIVGMAATPDGGGYRLVAADGGVFDYGDAPYLGSAAGQATGFPALGSTTTVGAPGYWVTLSDGQVDAFGAAPALRTAPTVDASACAGDPAGATLVVVSISQQELWACAGPDLVSASPVTTGASGLRNVHDATPTGTWRIQAKTTDVTLSGCDANGCWHDPVHYWMPFDGPYGFHDAPWQTFPFGSAAYVTGGSHGCVHLPEAEMAWLYSWAPIGTVVRIGA
jgi:lipoprotein-anchoring transpeptidase ErfK/SrfK